MSNLHPNSKDSIKEKCAKVCWLYITGHIDEEQLLIWLIQYKGEFNDKEFECSDVLKTFTHNTYI